MTEKDRIWLINVMDMTGRYKEHVLLGKWTVAEIDRLLARTSRIEKLGERIDVISREFIGTAYGESTLIGGCGTPEEFVINLGRMDCFTFLDCIEAMRRSSSYLEFVQSIKRVRYRSGTVDYTMRNHFFTDWKENDSDLVMDITTLVGGNKTLHIVKRLNVGKSGECLLTGIEPREREIAYIPWKNFGDEILTRLETGDYIGICSDSPGLDVTHVGILIKSSGTACLRHASSLKEHRSVIDQDFLGYIRKKPGIIVLRPTDGSL